ncbi:hypothetical protein Ahy_B06g080669 isoform C [Arachis hypogaea]|uniref:Uncharacterized protein n=1 Tax=Arachis hypogaea TaxID=3818 RepID=A0A444YIS6_ARAHY|nr:hypothetical protein Ahy_B06g080669 isoform C [Arachis hypogaea]
MKSKMALIPSGLITTESGHQNLVFQKNESWQIYLDSLQQLTSLHKFSCSTLKFMEGAVTTTFLITQICSSLVQHFHYNYHLINPFLIWRVCFKRRISRFTIRGLKFFRLSSSLLKHGSWKPCNKFNTIFKVEKNNTCQPCNINTITLGTCTRGQPIKKGDFIHANCSTTNLACHMAEGDLYNNI